MRAHLKSTDLHPITIVCNFETSSNITIIAHRAVEIKSCLAINYIEDTGRGIKKANGRIRTDNHWFTKPELYR
jgi:hypothetical protein